MILKIYGPRWVNVREQSQAESNAGFISLKKRLLWQMWTQKGPVCQLYTIAS